MESAFWTLDFLDDCSLFNLILPRYQAMLTRDFKKARRDDQGSAHSGADSSAGGRRRLGAKCPHATPTTPAG
eukprot:6198330-Pyramimonas_sp.AAC.1